jgi:hypothetical protein
MIQTVLGYKTPFLQVPELTWSSFRGRDRPDYLMDGNTQNICRHWAGISTGTHNQDVSFMLEGPKGTGKSTTGLTLCYNAARWEAEFLGTDWRDHFDIERTVAIVDPDRADEVMVNTVQYDVRLFDDISLAWGNRNWQSDENKDKNDIFIINRIDNTINILTSPNSKLIDVVPRSNVNFKGEMDTPYFNFGHTSLKIFKPIPMYRASGYKMLDPYMRVGRDKIVLYMVGSPPKRLWEQYNKERTRATEAIKKDRKEKLEGRRGEGKPASSVKEAKYQKVKEFKKNPQKRLMEEQMMGYSGVIRNVMQNGGEFNDYVEALHSAGVEKAQARRWVRNGSFKQLFPKTS